tara:strand:+ start:2608 stop:3435 length:828 start_codon:yes stop_codon:yes gene_type:complete
MMHRLTQFLFGIIIGIANIIPGVSAGTMAVILGIYDDLISAISDFFGNPNARREKFMFLTFIGSGFITSLVIFSKVLTVIMSHYPQPTFLFFIGLIVGSLPIVYKSHDNMQPSFSKVSLFLLGLIVMGVLTFGFPTDSIPSVERLTEPSMMALLFLSFSGFIAAGTMIIPGISGSLLLLLMGSYFIILNAIASFNLQILFSVAIGAILGIITLSKVMNWCLQKYPAQSYFLILGLMIGSLMKLWPGLQLNLLSAISLALAGLGAWLAWHLSRLRQ